MLGVGLVAAVAVGTVHPSWFEAVPSRSRAVPAGGALRVAAGLPRFSLEELKRRAADVFVGPRNDRAACLAAFVARLSPFELDALIRALADARPGSPEAAMRDALLLRLARLDPDAAIRCAEATLDPALRRQALQRVVEQWAQTDAAASARWVAAAAPDLQAQLAPVVLVALERAGLRDAADFAANLSLPSATEELLGPVLDDWCQAGFDDALAWVQRLPEGSMKEQALLQLSSAWIQRDPREAVAYLQARSPGDGPLLRTAANEWAEIDPAAAAAWVGQSTDGEWRTQLLPGVALAWAQQAPEAAARFVASLAASDEQSEAAMAVIAGWAQKDPLAAVQWAGRFPAGALRDRALTQAMTVWAAHDPAAVAEWAAARPENADFDPTAGVLSDALLNRFPALAMTYAQSISDPALRAAKIRDLAERSPPTQ